MSQDPAYKFYLSVTTPDFQTKSSAFSVNAFVAREAKWEPIDICSDATTAFIAGGVTAGMAQRIGAEREKLAKQVAEALTEHILNLIKARDTRNGYPQI